jgi:hypothetical protein
MPLDTLLAFVLVLHGVMGGVDTLLNHEYLERLPKRPEARREIGLHSMREAIYAVLFAGLGWFAWHGAAAYVIAALVLAEVGVTTVDEWTENRIRVLPQNERVLHIFLTLNIGVIVALLVPTLAKWSDQPTSLVPADHGWPSWALLALAAAAAEWSVLDLVAWRRLGYRPPPLTNSSEARKSSMSFS